ncbi:MAG: glycosyltransferase family 4 protein [Acidobacteria bacterium]|nr:MAG: glycosyltransferase family 4 protein [Acidobacteriota bacterium]
MIQIKREKRELTQIQRIEEMRPPGGIGHIAVMCNERVIEVKWVRDRRAKEQHSCENQPCCRFHAIFAAPDYMHIAIIHDWLTGMRGGEKVLEALLEIFPEATIYTLLHEQGKVSGLIESHKIVTSWLNRVPGVHRHYRNLLPLFPSAIASFDLSNFELVISSSHAVAKGVRAPSAIHVCYCHTPMRYVWDAEEDYSFNPLRRLAMRAIRPRLQRWDCEAAIRVDHFIANSRFVRERIRSYYGRDAEVIPPPVETTFFSPSAIEREDFYLAAGALVPYKRLDLIVEAFKRLDRRLVIAGGGSELDRLRKTATRKIDILGWVTDDTLRHLYRTAKALVIAAREDFGIVTVEAQACGCPVIAFGAGGSSEIVQDGINGILFAEQHADDIVRAVRRFELMAWPAAQVRSQVEAFSREAFQTKIRKFIANRTGITMESRNTALQPA